MKKIVVTALAAAALAAGTAAGAQDLGSILSGIFGGPVYNQSTPAVVAPSPQQGAVYTDAYGRRFQYDQYGRQVYLNGAVQPGAVYTDAYGRQIQYDAYGRPVYMNGAVQPGVVQPGVVAGTPTHLVSRFYLAQGSLVPGSEALFVLTGQPGGSAYVNLPSGMRLTLPEVQPGVYQGRYVVQWNENPQALSQVFGALEVGNTTTTTQLENRATTAGVVPGVLGGRRVWP